MSQFLTMYLEHEGPAKRVPGDLQSDDLFFANVLPKRRPALDLAAGRANVRGLFEFAFLVDEARRAAEVETYGKPLEELTEEDPEPTEEMEAAVDRITYASGTWFAVEEGLRTADALLDYVRADPSAPSDVADDLRHFRQALEEAARRGRRFRLRFSY